MLDLVLTSLSAVQVCEVATVATPSGTVRLRKNYPAATLQKIDTLSLLFDR